MSEPTFLQRLIANMAPWNTGPVVAGMTDLERFLAAIALMFEPVVSLAEEEGTDGQAGYVPSWGKLLDPTLCPAKLLPYLGQFVGVTIPVGASDAEARALVKAESGLARGTPASIKSAIERSISVGWLPLTTYLEGRLVQHEAKPGELLTYKVLTSFTSGGTFTTTHLELVTITNQYFLLEREKPGGETAAYHFTIITRPEQLTPAGNTAQLEANVATVKPAGLVSHYIDTDEGPLIDEGTRTIEASEGVIETATLANIT
jgi:hypothetical protein